VWVAAIAISCIIRMMCVLKILNIVIFVILEIDG
jgi:hypothetical protein